MQTLNVGCLIQKDSALKDKEFIDGFETMCLRGLTLYSSIISSGSGITEKGYSPTFSQPLWKSRIVKVAHHLDSQVMTRVESGNDLLYHFSSNLQEEAPHQVNAAGFCACTVNTGRWRRLSTRNPNPSNLYEDVPKDRYFYKKVSKYKNFYRKVKKCHLKTFENFFSVDILKQNSFCRNSDI